MKKYFFLGVAVSLASWVLAFGAYADTAFEEDQESAIRNGLGLYGGYVEDIALGADESVFAGLNSPNGIYYSRDGGATWIAPREGSDFGTISDVEISSATGSAFMIGGISLYRLEDDGSWQELEGSTPSTDDNNYAQTMHYGAGKLFVPVRDGTLDMSEDNGESFTNVVLNAAVTSLVAIGSSASHVYALASEGSENILYKSMDEGSAWEATDVSGSYTNIAVSPYDEDFIVLAGQSSILFSHDGADGPWISMNPSENGTNAIAFSEDRVYIGANWTNDDGITWHNLENEAASLDSILKGNHVAVDAFDTNVLYVSSGRGLAKSTDGGTTFRDMVEGMMGVTVNAIAQSADKKTVWVAAQGGLAKSENFTDASPDWEFPILPEQNVDFARAVWIDPEDTSHLTVAVLSNLYQSEDGGETWMRTDVATEAQGTFSSLVWDEETATLYAGYHQDDGGGSVWMSEDRGESWEDMNAPNAAVNAIEILDSELWVGVGTENNTNADQRGMYHYNGSSWLRVEGGMESYLIHAVLIVEENIFVAAGETSQGGVFRSQDGGSTWEMLNNHGLPDDGWYHALAHENATALYVSTARPSGTGRIYKSTDGGDNWFEYYTGLKDETFQAMLFDGLVAGTNTGLYAFASRADITMKADRKNIQRSRNIEFSITLQDAATTKKLSQKNVRIFSRTSSKKLWKLLVKEKTNAKGKARFSVRVKKSSSFQARWNPENKKDVSAYGESAFRSGTLRITLL